MAFRPHQTCLDAAEGAAGAGGRHLEERSVIERVSVGSLY